VDTLLRGSLSCLTFDMSGRRRPQAGGGPLDGMVRRHWVWESADVDNLDDLSIAEREFGSPR
jgi:hypothetical protein